MVGEDNNRIDEDAGDAVVNFVRELKTKGAHLLGIR